MRYSYFSVDRIIISDDVVSAILRTLDASTSKNNRLIFKSDKIRLRTVVSYLRLTSTCPQIRNGTQTTRVRLGR